MRKRSQFDRLVKPTAVLASPGADAGEAGMPAVQRSGPATLQAPSLLQPSDPASRYHLGDEQQLHLDPALLAMMRQLVE